MNPSLTGVVYVQIILYKHQINIYLLLNVKDKILGVQRVTGSPKVEVSSTPETGPGIWST